VRGLRKDAALALVAARAEAPFSSIDDLALRVPELRKDEITMLAEVGALNPLQEVHRREALWQAERAARPVGPLLESLPETEPASPLAIMTTDERLQSDFHGTCVTIGRHPMAYRRPAMQALGVLPAAELPHVPDGRPVRVAGAVIVRQRPGTAKGFVFLSMEDETGIFNVIVNPDLFDRHRLLLVGEPFLLIDGVLQNLDNTISVKAGRIRPLPAAREGNAAAPSHDFH
jgi:error-prone DNA polymerase